MKVSVAMITLNEEAILAKTLASVASFADEIVIVDSGSTDRTEEIAKSFGAKFVHQDWLGYGPQRNVAIDLSQGDWVLNIDADEEVSPALAKKIKERVAKEEGASVYRVSFTSVCFSKKIYHGGWSGSQKVRFFQKAAGRFNDNTVHEEFQTKAEVKNWKEEIYHHSYRDLEDYFTKFNRYTTEGAKDAYRKGKKASALKIVAEPIYKFLRMYVLRLGFLDGLEGFVLANCSALYSMVKYYKLYELYRQEKEK